MKPSTKGRISMKQAEKRTINVELTVLGETDVLIFCLDDEQPEKYVVNLNSSSSQSEIKEVFSRLLEILITDDIILKLKFSEGYSKVLYKDVSTEYINDLNREILQVKESISKAIR